MDIPISYLIAGLIFVVIPLLGTSIKTGDISIKIGRFSNKNRRD
ncbi:hypothetical protein [Ferrimonas sp. SCSIO 43195]|nr:hypothetical protein [Ferrimonas sp. SCSIO 43195]